MTNSRFYIFYNNGELCIPFRENSFGFSTNIRGEYPGLNYLSPFGEHLREKNFEKLTVFSIDYVSLW